MNNFTLILTKVSVAVVVVARITARGTGDAVDESRDVAAEKVPRLQLVTK